jgi:hypothetical protein
MPTPSSKPFVGSSLVAVVFSALMALILPSPSAGNGPNGTEELRQENGSRRAYRPVLQSPPEGF